MGFDPILIVPSQLICRARTGERRLMAAVLEASIHDYVKFKGNRTANGKAIFQAAHRWVFAEEPDWPFSFRSICDEYELDADWLRKGLGSVSADTLLPKPSGRALRIAATRTESV